MPDSDPLQSFPRPFGKYQLVKRVADGGMAQIYLALEDTIHAGRRFVTIKRIRDEHCRDPDFRDFFLTEGRVSLQCAHPNLPQVYELGDSEGVLYLAMEYIKGHTLLDILRGAIRRHQLLSIGATLKIGLGVAAALEHAHSLRDVDGAPLDVIHRDVTPQNVMVSHEGTVKLIDFGIVRSAIQLHQTESGIVKGKFAYMAPEQLAGTQLDHRADLFGLGIVLWESLVARPLFRGKGDLETIRRLRVAHVPPPHEVRPDVPVELSNVVLKALKRRPSDRFQSATEVLAALEHVAETCGVIPSVTRLRQEVRILCGDVATDRAPPPDPDLRPIALPDPYAVEAELVGEDDPAAFLPAGEADKVIEAQSSGVASDPMLLYFLDKANVGAPVPDKS